ncbi:uncharacterized protein LOC136068889 isoform X1 [Quercus suber]|uniref:uncharacterized protein LOC136068889 isoform X1 n=1 Tax=Quercus suber TaxID=58331 RepID=UPI0032DE596E
MVTITSMYLSGDAKLWWRTRVEDDADAGRGKIDWWEALKKELKDQFLPTNTAWVARDALKKLKQMGTVREYVKTFSSLMLDIKNMSEEDKLFNFMSGLQPWAQLELKRQAMRDLPSAMSAANALVDYKFSKPSGEEEKRKSKDKGRDKQKKDGKKKDKQKKTWGNKNKGESSTSQPSKEQPKLNASSFICNGPHHARDYLKREKLNAMVAKDGSGQSDEEVPSRVNPLQLLNALCAGGTSKGLSYVQVKMNENGAEGMLDSGATHNFVADWMVQRLGLKVSKYPSKIKAVNSEAKPVLGIAYRVKFKVGEWTGKVNFLVMELDDFDVILDEFLVAAKAALLPFLGILLILDEKQPYYIFVRRGAGNSKISKGKEPMVSAMQIEHGLKKGETTYLATLIEVK